MELDLGRAAFWLALGAWFVATALDPWLREKEVQKTLRTMIEKDGRIDADSLALIRGPREPAADGGASRLTGRKVFAAAIFFAAFMLGFASLMFFFGMRPGSPPPGMDEYLWGAGTFVIALGIGGVISYRVGRTPRRPSGSA